MAEEEVSSEPLLERAKELEAKYDWLEAADCYGRIVGSTSVIDPFRLGELHEMQGHALYKAALQSEEVEEFGRVADLSADSYARAIEVYRRAETAESAARTSRCEAMQSLFRFLRTADWEERRDSAIDSWELTMKSLDAFDSAGSGKEFCKTYNELFLPVPFISELVPDFQTRSRRMTEALKYGERAVELGRDLTDASLKARTLALVSSFLERGAESGFYEGDSQAYHKKALDYWNKAETLSKDTFWESVPLAWIIGDAPFDPNRDSRNELIISQRALEAIRRTRDRMLIGHALGCRSFYANWILDACEDKEEIDALMREAIEYAVEARGELSKIGFTTWSYHNIWVMSPEVYFYAWSAFYERDPREKRRLAKLGLPLVSECRRLAIASGYAWQIASVDDIERTMNFELAKTETNPEEKRALLEEAVRHQREWIRFIERFDAGNPYNLGWQHLGMADSLSEFAETMTDQKVRLQTFDEAMDFQTKGLEEAIRGMKTCFLTMDPGTLGTFGFSQNRMAVRLCTMYRHFKNPDALSRAVKSFESSADSYLKAGAPSRAAESMWGAARVYDEMEDPTKAADCFMSASGLFRAGADKIPRLKSLYADHATYMEAWAAFERGKYHHTRQEYSQAHAHFEKAADLHASTSGWCHMSMNYSALAHLENAEDLSRNERTRDSIQAFREATKLFQDSKKSLLSYVAGIESDDEKKTVMDLVQGADRREEYCKARVALEEARLLDKEGQMNSASNKYTQAAEMFQKVLQTMTSDQDRREVDLIIVLVNAWKAMTRAEADSSPELYEEASRLFEGAKNLSLSDKSKNLAIGHSRFCRALAAGIQFSDTGDTASHSTATQHLESASKYYLKADVPTASEYAKASKLLFDSYVFMDKASKEEDQAKKATLYAMTEKMLEASASSYVRADQPGKKDQVLRLLRKVKEDRELAMSLTEVFRAPDFASTATIFSTPTPSLEKATGLEVFEHANVQATLIAKPVELKIGESLDFEIELVNAGRGPAQLTRIEKAIPQGFDVVEKPEAYRIEDTLINLKGRRLDALKTVDLKLVLKPTTNGRFILRPRIMYLDESGKYKSHEPEPLHIIVKELVITGWLLGPEKKR